MKIIMDFLLNIFLQLYQITGNFGWGIIGFTILVRFLLLPLSLKSLKSQKEIKKLQPELKKLEKKHKGDKQKIQQAKMELFQKYNINPLAGCLPQLLQIGLLIVLYRVLIKFFQDPVINGVAVDTTFLWLNLSAPDPKYILPILAGLSQLVVSIMVLPGGEVEDKVPNKSKSKKVQKKNEKEEDTAEMAATMQQQMLFLLPIMTGFIALRVPSGLALYWVVTTVFSIFQQYYISGLGGLKVYYQRFYYKFIERGKNVN